MEYHDYNLFHEGGHGRPRVPMKPNNPFDFWVDHLSGFEHIQQQKNQAKIATSFDTDKARSWTESETARQIDVAVRRQATTLCGVFCRGAWADGASAAGAGARARRMIEHRGAKPADAYDASRMTKGAVAKRNAVAPTEPVAEWTWAAPPLDGRAAADAAGVGAVVAVVPYFGAMPEFDASGKPVGNSHSLSPSQTKLAQTRAALCAIGAHLRDAALEAAHGEGGEARAASVRVVVGVCSRADAEAIEGLALPLAATIQIDCGAGAYLAFRTLRLVQQRFDMAESGHATGRPWLSLRRRARARRRLAAADHEALVWWTRGAEYVYFSEADQARARRAAVRLSRVSRALARSR